MVLVPVPQIGIEGGAYGADIREEADILWGEGGDIGVVAEMKPAAACLVDIGAKLEVRIDA